MIVDLLIYRWWTFGVGTLRWTLLDGCLVTLLYDAYYVVARLPIRFTFTPYIYRLSTHYTLPLVVYQTVVTFPTLVTLRYVVRFITGSVDIYDYRVKLPVVIWLWLPVVVTLLDDCVDSTATWPQPTPRYDHHGCYCLVYCLTVRYVDLNV